MRTSLFLCLALACLFTLSACGGDNTSNSSSSSSNSDKSDDKPKTPAEQRQAVVDRMSRAAEANDADALKGLFAEDEHEVAEQRIGAEWRKNKTDGNTVKVKTGIVEEDEGKFVAKWEFDTTMADGKVDNDKPKLYMVEKDGKWYLTFKK